MISTFSASGLSFSVLGTCFNGVMIDFFFVIYGFIFNTFNLTIMFRVDDQAFNDFVLQSS